MDGKGSGEEVISSMRGGPSWHGKGGGHCESTGKNDLYLGLEKQVTPREVIRRYLSREFSVPAIC